MNLPKKLSSLCRAALHATKQAAGFTMIELLIVISILGILAVAVLSAIDPIEQINRGRDQALRTDTEQLISAIDRYNAFQGYYPWNSSAADTTIGISDAGPGDGSGDPVIVDGTALVDNQGGDCTVVSKLSTGNTGASVPCPGANELKLSYINRITDSEYRGIYLYNRGNPGDSTYVCFLPQSGAFVTEAQDRCTATGGLPADFPDSFACDTNNDVYYICLP